MVLAAQGVHFLFSPYSFFRNADAAVIVFDVSRKETFENAIKDTSEKREDFTSWVKETKHRLDDSRHTVTILGNS